KGATSQPNAEAHTPTASDVRQGCTGTGPQEIRSARLSQGVMEPKRAVETPCRVAFALIFLRGMPGAPHTVRTSGTVAVYVPSATGLRWLRGRITRFRPSAFAW